MYLKGHWIQFPYLEYVVRAENRTFLTIKGVRFKYKFQVMKLALEDN